MKFTLVLFLFATLTSASFTVVREYFDDDTDCLGSPALQYAEQQAFSTTPCHPIPCYDLGDFKISVDCPLLVPQFDKTAYLVYEEFLDSQCNIPAASLAVLPDVCLGGTGLSTGSPWSFEADCEVGSGNSYSMTHCDRYTTTCDGSDCSSMTLLADDLCHADTDPTPGTKAQGYKAKGPCNTPLAPCQCTGLECNCCDLFNLPVLSGLVCVNLTWIPATQDVNFEVNLNQVPVYNGDVDVSGANPNTCYTPPFSLLGGTRICFDWYSLNVKSDGGLDGCLTLTFRTPFATEYEFPVGCFHMDPTTQKKRQEPRPLIASDPQISQTLKTVAKRVRNELEEALRSLD